MQTLNQKANAIREELKGKPGAKVVITTHHKPDADAMGSSLGLYRFLGKLGYDVTVITPTDYAEFLHWLPGNDEVIIFEGNENRCSEIVAFADYIFCLDFNNLTRINELGILVHESAACKIMIDHHQEPQHFYQFELWTTDACSTSELIYTFITQTGNTEMLDAETAECLYTGIAGDTGGFRHRNTTGHTLRMAAHLIDCGADHVRVHDQLFDSFTPSRSKLFGYCLYEKLEIIEDCRTALIYLSSEELNRFNVKTGDTEGLVNFGLGIHGIVFSALIIDRTKLVKMSFRSKGNFACNTFAKHHFEGGGHYNAAGGQSSMSLEKTVEKFRTVLQDYKEELNRI